MQDPREGQESPDLPGQPEGDGGTSQSERRGVAEEVIMETPPPPGPLGLQEDLGEVRMKWPKVPDCCERRVPVWVPPSSFMPPGSSPRPLPAQWPNNPQTVTADVSCWALPSNTPRPTDSLSSEVQEKDSRGDSQGLIRLPSCLPSHPSSRAHPLP